MIAARYGTNPAAQHPDHAGHLIIGVGAVIAMIAVGAGAQERVADQIQANRT